MTSPNWTAIQTENPDLTIDNPEQIGEGWGARAYRVNDDTVFKLPKRGDGSNEIAKEFAVLAFVEPRLPLAVPKPLFHRQHSDGWPHGYAAYSLMPGEPIEISTMSDTQKSAAAYALAEFLRVLHGIEPDATLRSLLEEQDLKVEYRLIFQQAESQVLPQISSDDATLLRAHAVTSLSDPANFVYQPTLIHSDLHNDHLMVQEGVVTGVLDFGDAILSDPDDDFSGFYGDLGREFFLECAEHYGHPNPQALLDKLQQRAVFGYLYNIIHGPEYGLPGDTEWAWSALKEWLHQAT